MKQSAPNAAAAPTTRASPPWYGVLWLVARLFFRLNLGSRKILWLAALLLVPLGLCTWWRFAEQGQAEPFFAGISVNLLLQLFCLGLPLYLGVSAVRDEIEDRTITYLLVRPAGREAVLGGKVVSVVLVVSTWLLVGEAASFLLVVSAGGGAALARSLPLLLRHALVLVAGAVVYTGLFSLFGLLLRRPLLLAIVYALGWEATVSNLPGGLPRLTIMYYLKSLLGLGPQAEGVMSLLLPPLAAAGPATALAVLLAVMAVVYSAVFLVAGRKEYRL